MKVQVMSSAVAVRSFPAREGKPATHFREQTAAVLREGDFPLPFTIGLDEDQPRTARAFTSSTPSRCRTINSAVLSSAVVFGCCLISLQSCNSSRQRLAESWPCA